MPSNYFPDNGGYAQWGDWTECSVTCGTGHRSRRRYCTNPPPSPAGKDCSGLGPDTLTEECNSGGCPGTKMIVRKKTKQKRQDKLGVNIFHGDDDDDFYV